MDKPLNIRNASIEQKEEMLRYAADVRKFEIERFWTRSLFFWGFIGAAFIAYASIMSSERDYPIPLFITGCFGFISSFSWTLLNRGSKYWHVAWEAKIEVLEEVVLGANLFSNIEPYDRGVFWGPAKFSTSKLAIALSDFTAGVWALLVVAAFSSDEFFVMAVQSALGVLTISYAFCLFRYARQSSRKENGGR